VKRFKIHQRVRFLPIENEDGTEDWRALGDRLGTVVRLRRCDDGAWVRMDADLPLSLRSFTADDNRTRDIILYPEDCEDAS
jgi:hypothetical protein